MLHHAHYRFRHLFLAFSLLLLLSVMSFIVPQAHAATTGKLSSLHVALPQTDGFDCRNRGTFLQAYPVYLDDIAGNPTSTQIGELDLYYNSSNGYNCAWLYSVGPAYGKAQSIDLSMYTCQETSPDPACIGYPYDGAPSDPPYYDSDNGSYHYYAGPVGVYGKGHCITASGHVIWQNQTGFVSIGGAVHCG